MNLQLLTKEYFFIAQGLYTTFSILILSGLLGLAIAIACAFILKSKIPFLHQLIQGYSLIFRGTPLIIQLFVGYYGLAEISLIRDTFLWKFFSNSYFIGVMILSLNTGAYTIEIIKNALESVGRSSLEAAQAFGLSEIKTWKHIILPICVRNGLTNYSNEIIFLLHGTALAGAITVLDITGTANILYSRYYAPFESYGIAAIQYLVLTTILIQTFRMLERRFPAIVMR